MARRKVIIDTDPGVDDVLALLLALASEELEVLAITTVHGNIDLANNTRNIISFFNVLHEAAKADARPSWASRLLKEPRIVLAAGAKHPLRADEQLDAAYFHGKDGLGGVSDIFPQYLPAGGWESAFPALAAPSSSSSSSSSQERDTQLTLHGLDISPRLAHLEMLHILAREEVDTVTIVAVGPLTNLSLACLADYATFSRAREVVVMGGALMVPGNVTPNAEFNFLADPEAAAHLFSFTSPTPSSTFDTSPTSVERRLQITLLPLDTTTKICLSHKDWHDPSASIRTPSNLRETTGLQPRTVDVGGDVVGGDGNGILKSWCDVFVDKTFETMRELYTEASIERVNLSMHDPACLWYLLDGPVCAASPLPSGREQDGRLHGDDDDDDDDGWRVTRDVDIRVEIHGRLTRGACVTDRRGRARLQEDEWSDDGSSDRGNWLHGRYGNRVAWVTQTPRGRAFAKLFMERVFGKQ